MSGFSLLFAKILDSSIWIKESKETRLVWVTLLAMKDSKGVIESSVIGLADRAKVSMDECKAALEVFLSPDTDDSSGVEEGKRLRQIQGGWQVINNDRYRFSTEARREFWREMKEEQRAKQAQKESSQKTPVELPPGFPKTEQEAKEFAAVVGCPPEFAVTTWNQAMARGCKDSHAVLIDRFHYHLATCWAYQQNRNAESAAKKKPSRGQPRGLI